MKKNGFTLIEILAVIVIIGITATIGIIAVSRNINKSKDSSIVDLAKNYGEGARTMKGTDSFYYDPKANEALIIPYSQITGVDIENRDVTGYGEIVPNYCYVGIVNEGNKYKYYITQLDESYHFIDKAEYNSLSKDDILLGQEELVSHGVKELKAPFQSFNITYGSKTYSLKAIRVKYNTVFKQAGVTRFETKDLMGTLTRSGSTILLNVEKSSNVVLQKGSYTFNVKNNGSGEYQEIWSISGSSPVKKLGIRYATDESVVFDYLTGDKVIYKNVETTNRAELHGYYTADNSYLSTSAHTRGNITVYDTFVTTGKFPGASNTEKNIINYNGQKYAVNSSELLYVLIKSN